MMQFDNEKQIFEFGRVLANCVRNVLKEHDIETDSCMDDIIWAVFAKLGIIEFRRSDGSLVELEALEETYLPDIDIIPTPTTEILNRNA